MYDNIGGKIKVLAKVLTVVGIILVCGVCFVFAVGNFIESCDICKSFIAVVCAIGGSVIIWISSFILYGFGELIETNTEIRDNLNEMTYKKRFCRTDCNK